jgi:membrane peptidoglycan carboxypeptidase
MQTSLARRQARRMNGNRKRGSGTGRRALVAIPLFLFGSMALIALIGLVGVVGVFAVYSQDLPDVHALETYVPIQESVVYDRTGKIELARFSSGENRVIVTFDQIPPILIDATTAIEDKTFWTNTGFDPLGVLSATFDTLRGNARGASTITQQLVRQRLLDPELVRDPSRTIERKIKEIIQSVRVTDAYPGVEGKQRIITAYLNQNYYGNGSYGIKAAARSYFGVDDLSKLTLGQVALLAALPQSPSSYDLVRNAVEDASGKLCVPLDPANVKVVERRDYVLDLLATDPARRVLTTNKYTPAQFQAAKNEPICLAPQTTPQWKAPHFVWSIRNELASLLCAEAETCPVLEQGGLKITTTLDWNLQQMAEKWVTAAVLLPHEADPEAYAAQIGVPYQKWMKNLTTLHVNNGAMVALDYQTGEILAYVGSAGYYRSDIATPQFQPQFDVVGTGWRQPGSAFKPFNYVTGIDDRRLTAATMFMDVTTKFPGGNGQPYIPKDADLLERGPLRLREALNFSLNIPAVKALSFNGVDHVFEKAQEFGFHFQNDQPSAGLSLTLGTEVVHYVDLATAYGTLANGGRFVENKRILGVTDASGKDLLPPAQPEAVAGTPVVTPQAAYIVSDILAGNTDPDQNPFWGIFHLSDQSGTRRPAAFKTGTNNDAKDLTAAGFVAPPSADPTNRPAGQYALVAAAWAGNSDGSVVSTPDNPVFSVDVTAPMWQGFMDEATKSWPINKFAQPGGLVEAKVDAWSGGKPTEFTTKTVKEIFIEGTVPGDDPIHVGLPSITDELGNVYLWHDGCPGVPETKPFLDLSKVDVDQPDWLAADADWIARARQGPGVEGGADPLVKTKTSYFYHPGYTPYGKSWGAPFAPDLDCLLAPSPSPSQTACAPGIVPVPFQSQPPLGSPIFGFECPSPSPSFFETPSPTIEITPAPTPTHGPPTPPPTDTLPPPPTETPTLPPTETPTLPIETPTPPGPTP